MLYRSIYQDVPVDYYTIAFGQAALVTTGDKVTIVSYGAGVHWALEILDKHPNIKADLIDLRTLQPLDTDTIYKSVTKTGRCIILTEDTLFGGLGSDLSALVMENCFKSLDAPVVRVGSLETAIPFVKALEDQYMPKVRFETALIDLLDY